MNNYSQNNKNSSSSKSRVFLGHSNNYDTNKVFLKFQEPPFIFWISCFSPSILQPLKKILVLSLF